MQNKIIYTRKVATKLIEAGNVPVGTMPNPSKPNFLSWIFADTPKFQSDFARIVADNKKARESFNDKAPRGHLVEAPMSTFEDTDAE